MITHRMHHPATRPAASALLVAGLLALAGLVLLPSSAAAQSSIGVAVGPNGPNGQNRDPGVNTAQNPPASGGAVVHQVFRRDDAVSGATATTPVLPAPPAAPPVGPGPAPVTPPTPGFAPSCPIGYAPSGGVCAPNGGFSLAGDIRCWLNSASLAGPGCDRDLMVTLGIPMVQANRPVSDALANMVSSCGAPASGVITGWSSGYAWTCDSDPDFRPGYDNHRHIYFTLQPAPPPPPPPLAVPICPWGYAPVGGVCAAQLVDFVSNDMFCWGGVEVPGEVGLSSGRDCSRSLWDVVAGVMGTGPHTGSHELYFSMAEQVFTVCMPNTGSVTGSPVSGFTANYQWSCTPQAATPPAMLPSGGPMPGGGYYINYRHMRIYFGPR